MEEIKINKKPKLKKPYLIVAWPGMGEVAFKAASYLVGKLPGIEFAQIAPQEFFYLTGSIVQEGILKTPELPSGKFYYYKNKTGNNDLVIFISNAQPDLAKAESYCKKIISLAASLKVETVISLAAMPQAVDHTHAANVWFASTTKELNNSLAKFNLNLLSEGQISGMNGLFLGIAKQAGLDGFCLLSEIPLYTIQIDNPKAVHAVLDVVAKILNIKIDFSVLIEQAHVMEEEINKLLDYLKLNTASAGPIGEEDIEKIKKSLSLITKLPLSIKEKIEQLFGAAKTDISRANELKVELDKWNVYKEYEDRFLDLFKKKGSNNN
ncbi:MAG: PAC2 family protein [Candidatus Omnitrophota bacterium]